MFTAVVPTDLSRLVIHKFDANCWQFAASLKMSSCSKSDFHRLDAADAFNRLVASCYDRLVKTCYPQACCKLLKQLAASPQISTCSKSDFRNLHQHWCVQQTCCNLLRQTCCNLISASLLQVVVTTCSKSANIKLQQVWYSQTCCNLIKSTGLLQLDDKLQQSGKFRNLQQVCGVSDCVQEAYIAQPQVE